MIMFESLQRWHAEFESNPDDAFDRLLCGRVPLGAAGQLSLSEILDAIFLSDDAALDQASVRWLNKRILGALPERMSSRRWVVLLQEYFQAIATMDLVETNTVLRDQHDRIRLWLSGFYLGSDRDPEGAYLIALARGQVDQRYSSLWRRLILGQELAGRHYEQIGVFGFRKMPDQSGQPAADVPSGLLQAMVAWADNFGVKKSDWTKTMHSMFAAYRRNERYWVDHLAPLLPVVHSSGHAHDWLAGLLPSIALWKPTKEKGNRQIHTSGGTVFKDLCEEWKKRIKADPTICDSNEFDDALEQVRSYTSSTGDPEYLGKTFNNLAMTIARTDHGRIELAIQLIEEAMSRDSSNPRHWTSLAIMLDTSGRLDDAVDSLWQARQRFPWDSVVRNELARLLRTQGDLPAAKGVLREAISHFPDDIVFLSCLADLLIDLDEVDEAERLFNEVLSIAQDDHIARVGLARAWSIISAREENEELRDRAKDLLLALDKAGNRVAHMGLQVFDAQWQRALTDPSEKFRRDERLHFRGTNHQSEPAARTMSAAERLGRAMIDLWYAEREDNPAQKGTYCDHASQLLQFSEDRLDPPSLIAAFVEIRGLIMLTSGDAEGALAYFDEQIGRYGRSNWIGIYLGRKRARMMLGQPDNQFDDLPVSQSTRYALLVLQVVQMLTDSPSEGAVRELLKEIYPAVARLADVRQNHPESKSAHGSGSDMVISFVHSRWFRPAGVKRIEDIDQSLSYVSISELARTTRVDALDVITNATMGLAA